MKKIFIVHGFKGEPNGGWKPWLMRELDKEEIWALSMAMPNPYEPIKEQWVKKISEEVGQASEEVYLVGHSLGVPAVLRYLESLSNDAKIGGAFLVSGPVEKLEVNDPNSMIRKIDNFLDTEFDFEKIKKVCNNFVVVHGDNDERVPLTHSYTLRDILSAKHITIPGGGHLSGNNGVFELPPLLTEILRIVK